MKKYPKKLIRGMHLLNADPEVQKVIVIGCCKSGTYYMMKVLRILGLEVSHESMNKNGICSWYEVADNRAKDIKSYFAGHKTTYIHIVRNPIDVMNSTWRPVEIKNKHGLEFFHNYYPEYDYLSGWDYIAKYWIVWNRITQRNFNIDIVLNVENIPYATTILMLCNRFDIEMKSEYINRIKKLGTKTHSKEKEELNTLRSYGLEPIKKENILSSIKNNIIREELIEEALKYDYHLLG